MAKKNVEVILGSYVPENWDQVQVLEDEDFDPKPLKRLDRKATHRQVVEILTGLIYAATVPYVLPGRVELIVQYLQVVLDNIAMLARLLDRGHLSAIVCDRRKRFLDDERRAEIWNSAASESYQPAWVVPQVGILVHIADLFREPEPDNLYRAVMISSDLIKDMVYLLRSCCTDGFGESKKSTYYREEKVDHTCSV